MIKLDNILLSGCEVLPLIEGGKGISISNGESAGAWAKAGGVGTFSGVNADIFDENNQLIPMIYKGKTRKERHFELIQRAIASGIYQANVAHENSCGQGRIHMNVLWEMAGIEPILEGILDKSHQLIHGVTCGAGMPYKLAQICEKYKTYYYPIVSSARAFRALWKRTYHKFSDWLGAIVYEDPWKAGGHNGLSNKEDPLKPEDPYPRVVALRSMLNEMNINVPIIMAGGVWHIKDWEHWLNNDEIGPIAFQFGTRPLLTKESPISDIWKKKLLTIKEGNVSLNRFSPTGFYSSAIKNSFLEELHERSQRQVTYQSNSQENFNIPLPIGPRKRNVFVSSQDITKVNQWISQGFCEAIKTPDQTLIFVTPTKQKQILSDQIDCMGCLSGCRFSNWTQHAPYNTGLRTDPRSYCIQKTLQSISHGGDIDHELMFAGHQVYKFHKDPFYANNFIPTTKQLVERITTGY